MRNSTRVFVALPLSSEAADASRRAQDRLRSVVPTAAHLRWVDPESMHVTMKFIGSLPNDLLATAADIVRTAAEQTDHCEGEALGIQAFPAAQRARVLVVALTTPPPLATLQARLEAAFAGLGVAAEQRPFRAHVSLARLRQPRDARPWIESAVFSSFRAAFRHVVLFRSDLRPDGARYVPLHTARLGGLAAEEGVHAESPSSSRR